MSRSLLSKIILGFGALLLLGALALLTNGHFCTFNKASCGMVEPLLAIPVAVLGLFLTIGGLIAARRS